MYNLLFVNNFVNIKLYKREIGLVTLGRAKARGEERREENATAIMHNVTVAHKKLFL